MIGQQNAGQAEARNSALTRIEQNGSYEYVAFIDSDDIVTPNYLNDLITTALKTQADITACGFFLFDSTGLIKTKGISHPAKKLTQEEFIELIFSRFRWQDSCDSGGMVWKNLFKASSIVGLRFPPNRELNEDEVFCVRAANRANCIFYFPEKLYGYRQRSDSTVHSDKFNLKLAKGRALCIEATSTLSDHSTMVVASAFAEEAVQLFKTAHFNPTIDLKPYKNNVLQASKNGFIRKKTLDRYILFCDHPIKSKFYLYTRRMIAKLKCNRKHKITIN